MRAEILILSVLVVVVLMSSGCVQQPSGIVCNSPYIVKGSDCCLDKNNDRICDVDQAEEIKQNCPHECCEEGLYNKKECNYNQDCINNKCIKKPCPDECCDDAVYQTKSCSAGYVCLNNKCEEIKLPKLSVSIDACRTSVDITHGLGEVTDVYVSVTNYGTKDALNVQLTSTANDIESHYKESGTIGSLGPGISYKAKLTVDTKYGVQTTVSTAASCPECSPSSTTTTSADCFFDFEKIMDKIAEYLPMVG